MKIDYDHISEESLPKFKGGEKEFNAKFFSDGLNKIMKGRLVAGASIGVHTHETNSEIMYIISGKGYAMYGDRKIPLKSGDVHYCPKNHSHGLVNDGQDDLCFFAVVPEQ